jgi:hypothetical protein
MGRRLGRALSVLLLLLVCGVCGRALAQDRAPGEPRGPVPNGGTFDRHNAVGLPAEIVILVVIGLSMAGGLVYVVRARPGAREP